MGFYLAAYMENIVLLGGDYVEYLSFEVVGLTFARTAPTFNGTVFQERDSMTTTTNPPAELDLAAFIQTLGGPKVLASALRVSKGSIHWWRNRGYIPDYHIAKFAQMALIFPETQHLTLQDVERLYGKKARNGG